MPRGVRKSKLEKYKEELEKVQEEKKNLLKKINDLDKREEEIKDKISLEEYKKVSDLLDEHELSLEDLTDIIQKSNTNG